MIIIYYCIYDEYVIRANDDFSPLLDFLLKSQTVTRFNFLVKGEELKKLKDKTQIETNYSELNL